MAREVEFASRVNHDRVMKVYDAEQDEDGRLVMVCEYVRGQTVHAVLGARRAAAGLSIGQAGGLPWPIVALFTAEVLDGLQAMHDVQLVHRDVKPQNVMLQDGEGNAKLLDLGIAASVRAEDGEAWTVYGPLEFTYLESYTGSPCTPSRDIFAAAAFAFLAVSGVYPFGPWAVRRAEGAGCEMEPRNVEVINGRKRRGELASWALAQVGCSPDFVRLLEASLSPEPSRRCATARELAAALRFTTLQPVPPAPPSTAPEEGPAILNWLAAQGLPHCPEVLVAMRRTVRLLT